MRFVFLVLSLLLTSMSSAADLRSAILRDVRSCAAAFQRENIAAVIAFLPPRVVQKRGGRAALAEELKEQLAQAHAVGVTKIEAMPGTPGMPKQHGRLLASLVPVTAVAYSAHVELTQETHVLAISADAGKRWSLIPLYDVTQAELNAWYPEFRGKIAVPIPSKPRMQLVY